MPKRTKTIKKLEKDILEVSEITDDIIETIRNGFEKNGGRGKIYCNSLNKERYYYEIMQKLGLIEEIPTTYYWFNLTPKAKRLYNQLKKEGYFKR